MLYHKYPSLSTTYFHTFSLYFRTYIDALPFILLLVACRYLLDHFLPPQENLELSFFSRILLDSSITALFFSFFIYLSYQKNKAHNVDFIETTVQGVRQFFQVLMAYLFISLPMILALLLLKIGQLLWHAPIATPKELLLQQSISLTLIGIALFMTLILATYSFIAGLLIVINKKNALSGLRKSWQLIQPFWIDTFLLIVIFGMMVIGVSMIIEECQPGFSRIALTLLFSSFYPALMVIHFEQMSEYEELNPSVKQ